MRKLVCSCVVAAVAAIVAHGATTLDMTVGDSVAVVVRPDRYAEDPGAGFPIVLLSDVSKATSEVEAFADRYGNAVLVCAGSADRAGLLAELAEDCRLYAFPRGRIELPVAELMLADAMDKLCNYFKWGRYQAETPKVTRYGARIYRRNREDSAAPTISVPAPWRILEGDDGETGCDARLAYFTVEADGEAMPAPMVKVSWPSVAISSIDGGVNVTMTTDGVVLVPTAGSGGASYLTMVQDGAIELALHHHVEGAQHGPYAGRPLPGTKIRASDNWRAACWAMFRAAGLADRAATDGAGIKLYGFDSNFPRRHVDYPEHFHVMLEWAGWSKNNVGHYTLDDNGFIRENNFLVCGNLAGGLPKGYHPQKPGETTEYVGPKGRACFALEMMADGKGLVLSKDGSAAVWRVRAEDPAREVCLDVLDAASGKWQLQGAYSVADDTEKGEYVIRCRGPLGVSRTVVHYNRDTGALDRVEWPARVFAAAFVLESI